NAGPFWLTVDIFCGNSDVFGHVCRGVATERVARLFGISPTEIRRFDIADLNVVKFSFPRPVVQGSREDRDMHGAAWAVLLEELEVNFN
ncbi:MAG: DUF4387 family protein, partial [Rhodobacteraceae bacterium]|nr:DUF4387 family protein [Paracoccaceae bacterium]